MEDTLLANCWTHGDVPSKLPSDIQKGTVGNNITSLSLCFGYIKASLINENTNALGCCCVRLQAPLKQTARQYEIMDLEQSMWEIMIH